MNIAPLPLLAALIISLTALLLLLFSDWRISIGLLALQYLGIFLLIFETWPLALAVINLISGWIAGAVLGMALTGLPGSQEKLTNLPVSYKNEPTLDPARSREALEPANLQKNFQLNRFVTLSFALLVGLVILSVTPLILYWIPDLNVEQAWGFLVLLGFGLLMAGINFQVLPVLVGLLTFLAGFEVIYAAIQIHPLVTGLLAVIKLGLALTGAYLLVLPSMDKTA